MNEQLEKLIQATTGDPGKEKVAISTLAVTASALLSMKLSPEIFHDVDQDRFAVMANWVQSCLYMLAHGEDNVPTEEGIAESIALSSIMAGVNYAKGGNWRLHLETALNNLLNECGIETLEELANATDD